MYVDVVDNGVTFCDFGVISTVLCGISFIFKVLYGETPDFLLLSFGFVGLTFDGL